VVDAEEGRTRALALIVAAVFFAGVAAGLSRLALARYLRYDLAASVLAVSSLTSWFMVPRALSALAAGLLSDFSPRARRLLMSAPMLGVAVVVYLTGAARSVALVLLLDAAWGALSGMVWPVTQAMTALLAGGRAGSAMSLYFAAAFLGMVLGQGLYGVLPFDNAGSVRFSAVFFASAGLLLAAASRWAPPPALRRRGLRAGLRRAAGELSGLTLWILLVSLVMGYLSGSMREFLYVYLSDVYGLSRRDLAGVLSAAGVAAFLGSLAAGPMAERVGPGPVLAVLLSAAALGSLAVGTAPLGLAGVAAGIALVNVATRSSLPLTRNAAFLGTALASTIVAVSNTVNNVGQVVGPLASAVLYDAFRGTRLGPMPGHSAPFLAATLLSLAALAAYPLARRSQRA